MPSHTAQLVKLEFKPEPPDSKPRALFIIVLDGTFSGGGSGDVGKGETATRLHQGLESGLSGCFALELMLKPRPGHHSLGPPEPGGGGRGGGGLGPALPTKLT